MKNLKTFENWNDNIIDNSLFVSGRAKYNPKVYGGVIKYKTGTAEPYYFSEISKKGDKFICKIYKKKKNGEEIRLRNKIKKDLKSAHNYVREFLNQKLNKQKKQKEEEREIKRNKVSEEPQVQRDYTPKEQTFEPIAPPIAPYIPTPPKSRAIIHRF